MPVEYSTSISARSRTPSGVITSGADSTASTSAKVITTGSRFGVRGNSISEAGFHRR